MKRLAILTACGGAVAALAATGGAATGGATTGGTMRGVPNPPQARIDYILKCQGCHRPDGTGDMITTPPMKDAVARFLQVDGGRAFIGRVPGVAMTDLDDQRLAQLLNWTLYRFDPGHVPADFTPYSAAEIAALRRDPLRLDRVKVRADLVSRMETD